MKIIDRILLVLFGLGIIFIGGDNVAVLCKATSFRPPVSSSIATDTTEAISEGEITTLPEEYATEDTWPSTLGEGITDTATTQFTEDFTGNEETTSASPESGSQENAATTTIGFSDGRSSFIETGTLTTENLGGAVPSTEPTSTTENTTGTSSTETSTTTQNLDTVAETGGTNPIGAFAIAGAAVLAGILMGCGKRED